MGGFWASRAGFALATLVLAAGLLAALLAIGGHSPVEAGRALIVGSLGGPAALAVTATRAVPLALTGLGVALAFRAGVWNIGAEGQLYAGAIAAAWVGLRAGDTVVASPLLALPVTVMALSAAVLAGAAWTLVPAFLRAKRGVNEVVTTILLNFVALHFVSLLVSGPLQESRGVFQQTDTLAQALWLPALVPGSRVHVGLLVAVALVLLLWAFFRWTKPGFQVRAVGSAPRVAASAGMIDVSRVGAGAFLASGAIAGLAGGTELFGVTYALYEGLSPGWGYTAIAVALLGGLRPVTVFAAAGFFGALEAGGAAMQREAGIPAVWVQVVVAMVILAVVANEALGSRRRAWRPGPRFRRTRNRAWGPGLRFRRTRNGSSTSGSRDDHRRGDGHDQRGDGHDQRGSGHRAGDED